MSSSVVLPICGCHYVKVILDIHVFKHLNHTGKDRLSHSNLNTHQSLIQAWHPCFPMLGPLSCQSPVLGANRYVTRAVVIPSPLRLIHIRMDNTDQVPLLSYYIRKVYVPAGAP